MINTKRPNTDDYTQVGFIEAKDGQDNYQNIDHIYDSEGNIVFRQGYLNEYDGANDFRIPAIGKPLIDYTIYGNTFQDGIPTPGNPIMPQGTGERTGNLYSGTDTSGTINNAYYKNDFVYANLGQGTYTLAFDLETTATSTYYSSIGFGESGYSKDIQTQSGKTDGHFVFTFTIEAEDVGKNLYARFARFGTPVTITYTASNIMLNSGSTPLPYEPYGYKIPIMAGKYEFLEEPLRAVKTYKDTIDLGTKLLTRQIKELVLTGEENWRLNNRIGSVGGQYFNVSIPTQERTEFGMMLCSHYTVANPYDRLTTCCVLANYSQGIDVRINNPSTDGNIDAFKSYLTSQYTAGTPVTIWYVLAEPTTETISIPSGLTGTIEGVGIQNGTPTPDNPIMLVGKGERTGNLWSKGVPIYSYINDYKRYNPNNAIYLKAGEYSVSTDGNLPTIQAFDLNHTQITTVSSVIPASDGYAYFWDGYAVGPKSGTIHQSVLTLSTDCILTFTVVSNIGTYIMLNSGSTPLPYEPYGYKIPISLNQHSILLDESLKAIGNYKDTLDLSTGLLTRQVKKLVLTGEENWVSDGRFFHTNVNSLDFRNTTNGLMCSHLPVILRDDFNRQPSAFWGRAQAGDVCLCISNAITTLDAFKSYLAAQYANGTPVTIWYVLVEPTTETISIPSGLTGTIEGVGIQNGTPTPDNPIIPVGKGKRTENLFDDFDIVGQVPSVTNGELVKSFSGGTTSFIPLSNPLVSLTQFSSTMQTYLFLYNENKTFIGLVILTSVGTVRSSVITGYANAKYARIRSDKISLYDKNVTLVYGSIAPSEYIPYGYKIPISSAGQTTPVYLGEVETTRKIKKLVLTGEERNINKSSSYPGSFYISGAVPDIKSISDAAYCSHASYTNLGHYAQNTFCFNGSPININLWFPQFDSSSTKEEFRQYLAAQYAAGTPVTVWYVLLTEQAGIVNEPLMRIGDYTDTLSMEQAGVEIPTLKRPNTTEIDITTSLPPSEVYAKYRGSKTQQYDLFLAANGDSFEAKNGQSLYIGDDT